LELPKELQDSIITAYPREKLLSSLISRITSEIENFDEDRGRYISFTNDFSALPESLQNPTFNILDEIGSKKEWIYILKAHGYKGGTNPSEDITYKSKNEWKEIIETGLKKKDDDSFF